MVQKYTQHRMVIGLEANTRIELSDIAKEEFLRTGKMKSISFLIREAIDEYLEKKRTQNEALV